MKKRRGMLSAAALLWAVGSAQACVSDEPGRVMSPEQQLEGFLDAVKHAAPVIAEVGRDDVECQATPWSDVSPTASDRQWANVVQVQLTSVSRTTSDAPVAVDSFVIADASRLGGLTDSGDQAFIVQPWAGAATIRCGGTTADASTYVLIGDAMASLFDEVGLDLDARFDRLEANVREAGLRGAVDSDLTTQACSEEDVCDPGMEPLDP